MPPPYRPFRLHARAQLDDVRPCQVRPSVRTSHRSITQGSIVNRIRLDQRHHRRFHRLRQRVPGFDDDRQVRTEELISLATAVVLSDVAISDFYFMTCGIEQRYRQPLQPVLGDPSYPAGS